MKLKVKGKTLHHPTLTVNDKLIVDATTDELFITFELEPESRKQKVFAEGRKLLLEGGFVNKKFRFVDDIRFSRAIIGSKRVDAVTVKITYRGSWNNVRVR